MALAVGNCVPAMAAPAGWRKDASGWQYVNANGSVQKGWFQDTDGKWYFLDYNTGVMKTGWVKPADGNWYFMDYHTGAMKTGWIKPMDGKWYYLNPVSNGTKGAMKTGWLQDTDGKWYYLDATSGAMATGTVTIDNKVWTLDASGAWNGKDATSVTYVSSSSGSRRPSNPTDNSIVSVPGGTGNKETGEVTITGGEVDLAVVKNKLGRDIKDLTIEGEATLKNGTVKGVLTISEKVADGNVSLENVTVEKDTVVAGGGFNTVTFKSCKLEKVIAKKKDKLEDGTIAMPLHISFEGSTTLTEVSAEVGQVRVDVAKGIEIPTITTIIPIMIKGEGTVKTFNVKASVNVVVFVTVENVVIDKVAKPEIEVRENAKIENVTGDGAENAVFQGDGTVAGYYEITLDANGGCWVLEDIGAEKSEPLLTMKAKVKNGESIGTVLTAENFSLPENGTEVFNGWYMTEEATGEKVSNDFGEADIAGKTLYAGWVEKAVEVKEATIAGATDGVAKVGTELKAEANTDATGKLLYQWSSSADDKTYTAIEGATKQTYTVQEADAGKYIKVNISNDQGDKDSEPVKVEEAVAAKLVLKEVTATTTSGASATASVTTTATGAAATITVTGSSATVNVNSITFKAEDENVTITTDFKGQEVTGKAEIEVVCTPSDKKYEAITVKVTIEVVTTEN